MNLFERTIREAGDLDSALTGAMEDFIQFEFRDKGKSPREAEEFLHNRATSVVRDQVNRDEREGYPWKGW